jgi:cytochrome P450
MNTARRRDRLVYLRSHPVLFTVLSIGRRAATVRIGRTLLVHSAPAFRQALTAIPLDRTAAGTTGGAARDLAGAGVVFDEDGTGHRGTRRDIGVGLSATGVARLAPVWRAVLRRRLAPLDAGGRVDVVDLALDMTGATAAALISVDADPLSLARAARAVAASSRGMRWAPARTIPMCRRPRPPAWRSSRSGPVRTPAPAPGSPVRSSPTCFPGSPRIGPW